MKDKNYPAFFAVVMVLMMISLIPVAVEGYFNENYHAKTLTVIQTTYAASQTKQITNYLENGYIGNYGLNSLPNNFVSEPQVLGIMSAREEASPPYQAREIRRSNAVLKLNPDQAATVWVDFLNTGSATWYNHGSHFIGLNVTNPTGRRSLFQHDYWPAYYRPTKLLQNQVRPGEIGRFRFALRAPEKKGQYQENFNLVAENLTWIKGGFTSFNIGVGEEPIRPPDFQAQEVKQSAGGIITAEPGTAFTFWADFKNTGLQTWHNNGEHFIAINVTDPAGRVSPFKHDYWNEYYYRPARLMNDNVYPGEIGRFRFALRAPNIAGYYTENFALVAENLTWIKGGKISLHFKIGNPIKIPAAAKYSVTSEPNIRVGLYSTKNPVKVTANKSYQATNLNTGEKINKSAKKEITINYSDGAYWRIEPLDSDNETIMEITNFENKPGWNASLNDNAFRGSLEIRYVKKDGQMWVINELPIESYLKGLAEVSNGQPAEYLKALIVSARSYALWHKLQGGKHPDEHFDINATTDQVYRGYRFEQRSQDPLIAINKTRGIVIAHPDAISQINPQGIAVAPYSSGTDGRTRNWGEIWPGSGFPWLLSVSDPYGKIDNWNTLEGNHMVGLSAQGARGYAEQENKTYDWILKHYYTGITVKKIY